MFAVKGWSVDQAALKAQTEPFKSSSGRQQDGEPGRGMKRKRARGRAGKKDTTTKLESKGPASGANKIATNGDRKRQKTEPAASEHHDLANVSETASAARREGGTEPSTHADKVKKKDKDQRPERQQTGNENAVNDSAKAIPQEASPAAAAVPAPAKLTPMQSSMRQKLISARFRHLNQTLYTAPSGTSLALFDQNPEMFEDYHAGFRQQVSVWPENPLDTFLATVTARGKVKSPNWKGKKHEVNQPDQPMGPPALPRRGGTCTIVDLGCGDARLARTIIESNQAEKSNLNILSYDLHSQSLHITKADIANLPLQDGSVDVAIFCLALMGTNWISFVEEAYRILAWKGELWIAEIKSRFGRVGKAGKPVEHSVGGKKKQIAFQKAHETKRKEVEEVYEQTTLSTEVDGVETKREKTSVSAFVEVLRRRGFVLKDGDRSVDLSNKMFVKMEFLKALPPTKGKGADRTKVRPAARMEVRKKFIEKDPDDVTTDDESKVLKPCLYKVR